MPVTKYLFRECVRLLQSLARASGLSYEAVNVWIFLVIWPLLTLFLVGIIIHQRQRINQLRAAQEE